MCIANGLICEPKDIYFTPCGLTRFRNEALDKICNEFLEKGNELNLNDPQDLSYFMCIVYAKKYHDYQNAGKLIWRRF